MARTKPKRKTEPLTVHSYALTATTAATVHALAQEASDHTGWTVSESATMRTLLTWVVPRLDAKGRAQVFALIEAEQRQRIWGSRPR